MTAAETAIAIAGVLGLSYLVFGAVSFNEILIKQAELRARPPPPPPPPVAPPQKKARPPRR